MLHQEMDIDDWVFLPDDRFLKINQDSEKKQVHGGNRVSDLVLLTDYFDKSHPPPKQVVPLPFQLEPRILNDPKRVPIDFSSTPSMILEKIKEAGIESVEGDREVKTQVSFRKPSYNNESVDMTNKMDSTRSTTKGSIPQLDAAGTFDFDDDDDGEFLQNTRSPKFKDSIENNEADWEENSGGIWKWSLTGIGAICSFGVAAATFCIIIFGAQQRLKQHQLNQKLLFQHYTDEKRMKQVVHQSTKLNEAISAVRGVPITRAHITFGGYYDGI
ncbi:Detected protein of unknown function [Hibiscus syriacus]|uniref:DUF6821 domain-containing protein n=1 Tax=Hibiscus syriacus TaxID=106335 RepID=A0A6A2XMB8_HIBSY|nr:uncharacterized protein LOC120185340 [Hibiscus syriacus]KAE8663146.1 Detected protein of unknown function [Hibiscus syriacus]